MVCRVSEVTSQVKSSQQLCVEDFRYPFSPHPCGARHGAPRRGAAAGRGSSALLSPAPCMCMDMDKWTVGQLDMQRRRLQTDWLDGPEEEVSARSLSSLAAAWAAPGRWSGG